MDCIWEYLKNIAHLFSNLRYVSYQKCHLQMKNHYQFLCGHDFANERLLVGQFDI